MSLKYSIFQSPMKISLVLWLSFFFCCCWASLSLNISLVSGHSVHCLDHQKFLLLQLKKNLKFNSTNSNKLVSWNESIHCSQWRGVSWDEEGHVAGLDLSDQSISGGLDNSNTLFSLQYIKHLNLAFSDFNSGIPSGIKDLKSLTSLNLSNAGFVGQIPMEIAQLTKLAILDLSTPYNYFLERPALKLENPNLMKLVQNLSEVRELYLDGIDIALKGNEWGRALSSFLPHLQVLSMSRCNLSGPIDSSLETLQNLSIIRLDENLLSATVPDFFAKFSNLTQLDLSYCNLSGMFPNKIFQVQSLTYLDLSYNDDLQGSLPDFPQNGSLQALILSYTNFSGALPDSISNLGQLSRLEIYRCQFNGTLPDSMSNLTELTYLHLSHNSFTGPIPPFGTAKKLTLISLSNNKLSGGISSAHFKGLVKLVTISLWNNFFNGSVPMSLFSLPSLQNIDLSYNRFQGQLDAISNVSSSMLQFLDLSSNYLEGPIPQFIFHLRGLKFLLLSSNKFNGTIQVDMFRRLDNLTYLDLSDNNLSIDMNAKNAHPLSFPKMTSLMLASCNHIEGPILEKIMDFKALFYLNLSSNNLSGHIPSSIGKLQQLEYLDLSKNSLTGEIPQELANLPSLSFVNLSYNHLVGRIPAGAQLQSFDASSFKGSDGLYGPPLTQGPNNGTQRLMPPPPTSANNHAIDFEFITGLIFGVVFGVGIIIWPLFFWKQWRIRYWKCVAFILCSIFPQIYVDYQRHEGQWFTVLRWGH